MEVLSILPIINIMNNHFVAKSKKKIILFSIKIKMINTEDLQKLFNDIQSKLMNSISSNNSYNGDPRHSEKMLNFF